ncbi:MAG: formate--tetrahydrofolate ligase [Deltaproteobacteria bacterium]|nr:formate--tetrahydrofolate ligase [Deltaproteobacteria bacterium]
MLSDRDIAEGVTLRPIEEIAASLAIPAEALIHYGPNIAKVRTTLYRQLEKRPDGRLILVTAMSPTPAGEGKTTVTIGLAQAFRALGLCASACIRQPSLGPFFGSKGGATGGGYSQALPPDDIALQFTGDDYAIIAGHNLISSVLDNHIHYGNRLGIDTANIFWRRVAPISDRALRKVVVSPGTAEEREDEFHISAASELMSTLCLVRDLDEFKARVGNILLALDRDGRPVTVNDLKIGGAVTALMRSAIHPNLVQTNEGSPVFIHGGPFGNISLGCNSLVSTSLALKVSDYVITEAGFSTELGAEKFFDIKCRAGGLKPDAVVIIATTRALRLHGGAADYLKKDTDALKKGLDNLGKHIENVRSFGVPFVVAVNRRPEDDDHEIDALASMIKAMGAEASIVDCFERGGAGGVDCAERLVKKAGEGGAFRFLYNTEGPVIEKIGAIAMNMYGAEKVELCDEAKRDLAIVERLGCGALPVCIAKTPRSLSDNPKLLGRPVLFTLKVKRIRPALGAGYLVVECGDILLMPGLPSSPRAELMDVDAEGRITGI